MHTHRHRAAEALAAYSQAKMPTNAQLHAMAAAFAAMLAADIDAPVTVTILGIEITRNPVNTAHPATAGGARATLPGLRSTESRL